MNTNITFKTFLILWLLLTGSNIYAQTLSITGQLTTHIGRMPIAGATVVLLNTNKGYTTDALGNFNINSLSAGNYKLVVSYLGFEKFEKEIALSKNQKINIALKPSTINLTEVTVSPQKSITQSESVTGVDKLLRPVNSSQDLLRLVPGLFIVQHAGGGKAEQIFLRGFDSDHGTDFNISVDGMPVNMVSHAHGQGYADFHFVIPETIDQLKVFKGPYTTRFGDFATSGTGEFSTKNSIENNEVKAEIGMYDTYRVLGMVKILDQKHLFSKQKENIYATCEYVFTNAYFEQKQKFNRFNVFGKYTGMLNEKNYLTFSASTFFADWDASGQVPQRAVDAGIITPYGSIDPSEGGQTKRSNINAVLTTTIKNSGIIKNQLYYVNYYFNLYSNFTFYLNNPVKGDEIKQTDTRNILGYSGTYQKDFSISNKTIHFATGVGTRNDFTQIALMNAEKRNVLDTIVSGKVYQQNTNTYVDFTLDINKHFSINAGTRLDYFQFHFSGDDAEIISGRKSILRASPKLNFFSAINDQLQFFIKSGIGFHSNDARAVISKKTENTLPKAYGAEIGSEFKLGKHILVNTALWGLNLESELVYIGDEGTVETNNPTQRVGIDLSIRYQITNKLFADADLNYNHGRLVGVTAGENYIPLAPVLTSSGGMTYRQDKGINASLRYRFIDSRPANESNSVIAKGYFLLDAVLAYKISKFEFGLSAQNLLNSAWNEAQFDTESRLFNEPDPVSELHYTPGTPIFLKANISFCL